MSEELTPLEVSKQLKDFVLKFVKNGLDRRLIHGSFDTIETSLKRLEIIDKLNEKHCEDMQKKLKAFEIINEEIEIYVALRFPGNQPMLAIFCKGSRIMEKPISKDKYDVLKEGLEQHG